jgi:hypothetical protein
MREEVAEGWRNLHTMIYLQSVLFLTFDESDKNAGGRGGWGLVFRIGEVMSA